MRECRGRARLVDDPRVLEILDAIRRAMGCPDGIDVRELPELTTAATAGWRRPFILLPADWDSWSDGDLRAVLAHELAHIVRADYAAGLVSRLALALHFYHPIVRWMAGRLLVQQELAADALGARFAGGQGPYLAALSRMALRQDGTDSCWPARAFLPAKGTLIRRIEMLRKHDEFERSTVGSTTSRRAAGALLLALSLGVWGITGAVRAGAESRPSGTDGESIPAAKPGASDSTPAFDLSYVPADAMGVVAFHPAATFRRQGMGIYAAQLNALAAKQGLE